VTDPAAPSSSSSPILLTQSHDLLIESSHIKTDRLESPVQLLLLVWAAAFHFLVLCSFDPLLFVSPIVCLSLGGHSLSLSLSLSLSPSLSLLHLYLFLNLENYFTSPYKITLKLNLS
jgi:hypothetical protein